MTIKTNSKFPIFVFLDNIRSLHNVGAFFRTCDAAKVSKLLLSGYTPVPARKEITKTALGAESNVPFEYVENPIKALQDLKKQKVQIVAVETKGQESVLYTEFVPTFPVCLIFGNEVTGISQKLLDLADKYIHIPMLGIKESLNVSVAGGIVIYEMLRKLNLK